MTTAFEPKAMLLNRTASGGEESKCLSAKYISCCLLWILCSGCAGLTPRFANIEDIKDIRSNEAIAVGRLRIARLGKDITKNCLLLIEHGTVFDQYKYVLPESGLICARLPAGESEFRTLVTFEGGRPQYTLGKTTTQIFVNVNEPGRFYYIGDITLEFKLKRKEEKSNAPLKCDVQDNLEETRKEFQEKIHNAPRELIPSRVRIQ